MKRKSFDRYNFALVVAHHPDGRFLAVRETRGRGWWLPAGFVQAFETHAEAAMRETREEAGIDVELCGILRVEYTRTAPTEARQRIVFFARPVAPDALLKQSADSESEGAAWFTLEQLEALPGSAPGVRGHE